MERRWRRLIRRVVAAGACAFVVGCGRGEITVPQGKDIEGGLQRARSSAVPVYFLGREFAGLPLTDVQVEGRGRAYFAYGTCVIPGGIDGGCSVPVQIQVSPFDQRAWRRAVGCHRRPMLRGVLTVRHDGLVLFTRQSVVKVYARSAAEDRRAALALRDVRHPEQVPRRLPQPPDDVVRLVRTVCR
jgi:hypothetical protein